MNTDITLPEDVMTLLTIINDNGFESFVTGGCVRDTFLNRIPHDWDITTNATPEKILNIFSEYRTIPTGLKHGTVTVMYNDVPYEITTYRIDGNYSDNRHPDSVVFTRNLCDDLARRDFTINAMAYSPLSGLQDFFGGLQDLNFGIIRCVGNPDERFNEDALRMMRAFRFSAQLGFLIEKETLNSIGNNRALIVNISAERIQDELNKILLSDSFVLQNILDSGLLDYIIPEFSNCFVCEQNNPYHLYNVGFHTLCATNAIKNELFLKLTMLFHDVAKPITKSVGETGYFHFYGHDEISAQMAENILRRLKYDNFTIEKVKKLIEFHMVTIEPNKRIVRRLLNKLGEEDFRNLLSVRLADKAGMKDVIYWDEVENNRNVNVILDEILNEKEAFSLKNLAVNGDDLKSIGFKQGKELGQMLNHLMEAVLEDPSLNEKEILLRMAKNL